MENVRRLIEGGERAMWQGLHTLLYPLPEPEDSASEAGEEQGEGDRGSPALSTQETSAASPSTTAASSLSAAPDSPAAEMSSDPSTPSAEGVEKTDMDAVDGDEEGANSEASMPQVGVDGSTVEGDVPPEEADAAISEGEGEVSAIHSEGTGSGSAKEMNSTTETETTPEDPGIISTETDPSTSKPDEDSASSSGFFFSSSNAGVPLKTIITTGDSTSTTLTDTLKESGLLGAATSTTSSTFTSPTSTSKSSPAASGARPDVDISEEDVEGVMADVKEAIKEGMVMQNTDNASGNVQAQSVGSLSQTTFSVGGGSLREKKKRRSSKVPEGSEDEDGEGTEDPEESSYNDEEDTGELSAKYQPSSRDIQVDKKHCELELKDSGLQVILTSGDILHSAADVIVTGEDPMLQGYGGVSQALLNHGKKSYKGQRKQQLEKNEDSLERGKVYFCESKVGEFQVAHAIPELKTCASDQDWESSTAGLYREAVKTAADKQSCFRIAFPVLGSGTGKVLAELAVKAALQGLTSVQLSPGRRMQVLLFSHDKRVLALAEDEMKKLPGYVEPTPSSEISSGNANKTNGSDNCAK